MGADSGARRSWLRWLSLASCCRVRSSSARRVVNARGATAAADPPRLHGPYPTWMRQEAGHQVTRTLSTEQAERLRPLVAADRRLRQLVRELESLALSEVEDLLG